MIFSLVALVIRLLSYVTKITIVIGEAPVGLGDALDFPVPRVEAHALCHHADKVVDAPPDNPAPNVGGEWSDNDGLPKVLELLVGKLFQLRPDEEAATGVAIMGVEPVAEFAWSNIIFEHPRRPACSHCRNAAVARHRVEWAAELLRRPAFVGLLVVHRNEGHRGLLNMILEVLADFDEPRIYVLKVGLDL